jgi:hypothetical protein
MKISKDKIHGCSFSKRALLCVIFVLLPIIHFFIRIYQTKIQAKRKIIRLFRF